MGVTERVDGNAGGKVEIALAVGRDQPNAFAPLEGEVDARKGRHQVRGHGRDPLLPRHVVSAVPFGPWQSARSNKMCRLSGRHDSYFIGPPVFGQQRTSQTKPRRGLGSFSTVHSGKEHVEAALTTLAPDSRHIVAFSLSSTTSRAADSSLKRRVLACVLGGG
jgi:hypothetical protein